MKIVEMHMRVRLYLDRQNTPRFRKNFHIDQALNIAHNRYIDNIVGPKQKNNGIQLNQDLRDKLSNLITIASPALVPVANTINISTLTDYRNALWLMVNTNIGMRNCRPVLENEYPVLQDNSFEAPTEEFPIYREIGKDLIVSPNPLPGFNTSEFTYLKNPATVLWSEINIFAGPAVLVAGKEYYVLSGTVTHNAVNYNQGQYFVAANTTLAGTGIVNEVINSTINDNAHEEICIMAAKYLAGEVDDAGRYNFLRIEENT